MPTLLTQTEADALMAMPKRVNGAATVDFPTPGERLSLPLISIDATEDFLLDVSRARIDFAKITYQNRAHVVVVLARLDLNGPPHRNPDDEIILCPHLHLYRENYGDKWAFPVDVSKFKNMGDHIQTLLDFMTFCKVVEHPTIQAGIF